MTIVELTFYLFATVLVIAAFNVITVRNPVYAALFLVLTFFSAAAIWLLLEVEFLAITLVLVYVGAVMVLFLFVVMMLDINLAPLKEGFARYLPVGLLVAITMAAELIIVFLVRGTQDIKLPDSPETDVSNTQYLGNWLYTEYLYPFEIAAVILLVAIIAAIALTHRQRRGVRQQDPSRQVKVNPRERVRLTGMQTAKRDDG